MFIATSTINCSAILIPIKNHNIPPSKTLTIMSASWTEHPISQRLSVFDTLIHWVNMLGQFVVKTLHVLHSLLL